MGFLSSISKGAAGVLTGGISSGTNTNSLGVGSLGDLGSISDIIPGIGDARAQANANKENKAEAAINRAFQERMSSTAYQRAMQDMKSAGLNPMLAYSQGGASAPSGGQATIASETKSRLGDFALQAATGLGSMSQKSTALQQQQSMNESSIRLNQANELKTAAETQRTLEQTKLDKGGTAAKVLGSDISTWLKDRFKAIKNSSAKDAKENKQNPLIKDRDIKVLGPAKPLGLMKWLQKK